MRALYTIGYEGTDVQDFVETLRRVGVEVVIDIRELAISRRQG
jgi:uncharacterized protein (DUF488 family)